MVVSTDPRIHVTASHLRDLQFPARGLSLLPRQPSRSVLNGRHRSRLRGRGLNFEEMRDYLPGDDIRSIDWKTTARMRQPYVRVLTEERDRPVLVVVDQRMSMFFGSQLNMKSVTAAEAAALVSFIALAQGDRVGTILFNDEGMESVKPMRSMKNTMRVLDQLAVMNQSLHADKQVDEDSGVLNRVLEKTARIAAHDHLVVVISDFGGIDSATEEHLSIIAHHNDLVCVLVSDPIAREVTDGNLVISNGRQQVELALQDKRVRESVGRQTRDRLQAINDWQTHINLSVLPLDAGVETISQVRGLLLRGRS